MTKHRKHRKISRRKYRGGGWFDSLNPFASSEPEDPYAPKSGMLDSIGSYFSSGVEKANTSLGDIGTGLSNYTSDLGNKASSLITQPTETTYTQPTSTTPTNLSSVGGKRKRKIIRKTRKMRKMRGGKGGLGLTYYASPVSGIKVAEPTYWIKGGSTRRKTRHHRKR